MQIFSSKLNLDFLKVGNIAVIFSLLLILVSIAELAFNGLNFGLDFTGGTKVEVRYDKTANLKQIRKELADAGHQQAVVQYFGTSKDVTIRLGVLQGSGKKKSEISNEILTVLGSHGEKVEMRGIEFVSATVGEELAEQGILAVVVMLISIMLYVALRFEWKFAVGAVVALAHDVLITTGVFSLFGLEFDLNVLAAILAVIGYSLNDTIVVYDRIRENFLRMRKGTPREIINISLNQTLSRTLITSGTTIFVLIALFIWGGQMIHGFSTALLIGIVIGTYSSIYVASLLALKLGVTKEDLMPTIIEKEGADQDALM